MIPPETWAMPLVITVINSERVRSRRCKRAGCKRYQVGDRTLHLSTRFTEQVELVVGLILILVILFVPMGFVGLATFLKQKWFAHSR